MTAITSTYAHAYQSICLAGRLQVFPHQKCRSPAAKARYPHLPNFRTTTRERGNDFHGWATYTGGGTRSYDGETVAGWAVVARSPEGRIYIMFGLVITTKAHLAYAGARIQSNNTAELSSIVQALSFLGARGPLPVIHIRIFSTIPITLPAFAWALSSHARTSLLGSHVSAFLLQTQ